MNSNKTKINALIVVEGKTDIDFLSSFIEADFYSVNGSAINNVDIDFIKKVSENKQIIVLTDPDFPGTKIRNFINENVKHNVYNAYVRKEFSIKNNKVGVAESTKDEVLNSLKNLKSFNKQSINKNPLIMSDLYELGLIGNNSSIKRKLIEDTFYLGHSNAKQLLKKINCLQIPKKEIEEVLKNVK